MSIISAFKKNYFSTGRKNHIYHEVIMLIIPQYHVDSLVAEPK